MKQLGIETSEYQKELKRILDLYGDKLNRHALWQVCCERASIMTGNVPTFNMSDCVRSVAALLFTQLIVGGYSKANL